MLPSVVNSRPHPRKAIRCYSYPSFGASLTPFVSRPYKCPLSQTLSFHILANAWGYTPLLAPRKSSLAAQLPSRQQSAPVSPLAATLMNLPASVANKRLTAELTHLDATLTKNPGATPPFDVSTFRPSAAQTSLRTTLLSYGVTIRTIMLPTSPWPMVLPDVSYLGCLSAGHSSSGCRPLARMLRFGVP